MNDEIALHNKWLGGEAIKKVRFSLNDCVKVIAGNYAGERGSVVSIVRFESNIPYIVETESGKDIEVRESEIEIIPS